MSPTSQAIKKFRVRLAAEAQIKPVAEIEVYALNDTEAQQKIQDRIDGESLPEDLEFEDEETGISASLDSLLQCENFEVEIDNVRMEDEDVSPEEILEAQVEELYRKIKWDENSLAKHRVFLQGLVPVGKGAQGN